MELYIHIPFCIKKCRYCGFASFTGREAFYERYVNLLIKEAEQRQSEVNEPIKTVYIGGGTPSLLPASLLRKMTDRLRDIFDLNEVSEYTTEANPGTLSLLWLETAVYQGINRLSIGMQAYQKELLDVLGRIHQYEDVVMSVERIRKAGIKNLNLDLMFGIPTQTKEDWIQTLEAALLLKPDHISAYGLIPEDGTPLLRDLESGTLQLPDSEDERQMYEYAIETLRNNGLNQYEISNFAVTGFECRHNIGYWTQIPYLGIGVSAASMSGICREDDGISYRRRTNPDTLERYEAMVEENQYDRISERISPREARFETMMLGLRMNKGVSEGFFRQMHGKRIEDCYGEKLYALEQKKLLIHDGDRWKLTRRGMDIQNSILVELLD